MLRKTLLGIVSVIVLGLSALTIALTIGFMEDVSTPPFLDEDGNRVPGSLATMEWQDIGGIPQWTLLRARDISQPILIVLHGGPGAIEAEAYRAYNAELEDHFLVVHWHQRGAGWTLDRDSDGSDINSERIYQDLEELVELMKTRFGRDKVFLAGHSWGSIIGLRYTYEHPENVAAYVGIGQVQNLKESEKLGCGFILEKAQAEQDADAVAEINKACAFVSDDTKPYDMEQMFVQRGYLNQYGGAFHGPMGMTDMLYDVLTKTDEGTLSVLLRMAEGSLDSADRMWPELMAFDAAQWTEFKAPIFFALGRHDFQVNASLAADYFETLNAPCKHLEWFENSAHSPLFEEAETFNHFMINTVKNVECSLPSQ